MKYSKYINFIFIALIISDAFTYISWVGALNIDSATYIMTALHYVSISIMLYIGSKTYVKEEIPYTLRNLYLLWIWWLVFNFVRGAFLAQDYWEWKFLFLPSLAFTLVPLAFFVGFDPEIGKINLRLVLKYLFLFGFAFIPLALATNDELYSRLMIPSSLFVLFIPYLKNKWKFLVILVALTSMLVVIDFRSNIIKIFFSTALLPIYYFRKYIGLFLIRLAHLSLFLIPIILFILAVTGRYNIFAETADNESYTISDSGGEDEDLMFDSRTFLYTEVFLSINSTTEIVIGKSAIGSYKTDFFDDGIGGTINGKRFGSEVGMLNIFMRYGLVGVIIYSLLIFVVSWYAINRSNNILAKMLGLFIAFRFTYSFIEEFTQYDLNFYFFWVAIGLVSSSRFRNMDEDEIKNYLQFE